MPPNLDATPLSDGLDLTPIISNYLASFFIDIAPQNHHHQAIADGVPHLVGWIVLSLP